MTVPIDETATATMVLASPTPIKSEETMETSSSQLPKFKKADDSYYETKVPSSLSSSTTTSSSSSSSIPMITPAKPSETSSNSSSKINTVTPYGGDVSNSATTPAAATPAAASAAPVATPAAFPLSSSVENYVFGDEYKLPPLILPPQSEMEIVETFVLNAVASKHIDNNNNSGNNNEKEEGQPKTAAAAAAAAMKGYKAIIDTLRGRGSDDPEMLHKVLIALRTAGHGSTLRKITSYPEIHAHLNHCIFKLNSVHPPAKYLAADVDTTTSELYQNYYMNGKILDAHIHLLLAIVSARSVSTVPALTWVWKMIPFQPEEPIMYRLHAYLFQLLRLIPKARTDIFSVIASCAPYWTRDKCHLDFYFLQCIRVINYLPAIRKSILELIIDKCLEIDIHIHIQDNGDVLIEKDQDKEKDKGEVEALALSDVHLSQAEPATDATTTTDNSTTKPKEYEKLEYPSEVAELSDKLDSSLALILETIQTETQKHSNSQQQRLHSIRQLYYEIYPIFESTILTTHKAKFVQYCMFLLCGLEVEQQQQVEGGVDQNTFNNSDNGHHHKTLYCDFTSKLLEIVTDPYRATLTRQSGACYLASFVSRASYVCPETVCHSVSSLLTWAETYIAGGCGAGGNNNIYAFQAADTRQQTELHSLFYTVCQAAFYIMCFRGAEAIKFMRKSNNGDDVDIDIDPIRRPDVVDIGKKRWTKICNHPLKPLRFCLESVRSEFLHLAHAFDLIEEPVFDKLVTDAKRMSTGLLKKRKSGISTAATLEKKRQEGGVGGLGKGSNPLKSFFPFDPLLLSCSHVFIEPFYNEWQGPVEEEDVLEIDENDDDNASVVSGVGFGEVEEEHHDGGVFVMDEDDVDDCDDDDDDDDDDDTEHKKEDDEETDDDSDSDSEFGSNHNRRDLFGETPDSMFTTPDVAARKEEQRWAWTEITKRKRSQSMSSTGGSW